MQYDYTLEEIQAEGKIILVEIGLNGITESTFNIEEITDKHLILDKYFPDNWLKRGKQKVQIQRMCKSKLMGIGLTTKGDIRKRYNCYEHRILVLEKDLEKAKKALYNRAVTEMRQWIQDLQSQLNNLTQTEHKLGDNVED